MMLLLILIILDGTIILYIYKLKCGQGDLSACQNSELLTYYSMKNNRKKAF